MPHYCSVCGRELTKTNGPIGPKCLQKMRPRNIRTCNITKSQYLKMWARYDMYGENNGQEEDDGTGEGIEEQEIRPNGEGGKTTAS